MLSAGPVYRPAAPFPTTYVDQSLFSKCLHQLLEFAPPFPRSGAMRAFQLHPNHRERPPPRHIDNTLSVTYGS